MLGRNHAVYAGMAWAFAFPYLGWLGVDTSDAVLFAITAFIAAGAGVVPDLDHPDARPSKHFGILTKVLARAINDVSGGHRYGTHSFVFAALLGGLAAGVEVLGYTRTGVVIPRVGTLWMGDIARVLAVLCCSFCASVGLALVGPSLNFRIPLVVDIAAAVLPAWYVWVHFEDIAPLLPILAAGGVLCHIACDAVTRGGVPVFWPFTKRRFALHLFTVGSKAENFVGGIGVLALLYALHRAVNSLGSVI